MRFAISLFSIILLLLLRRNVLQIRARACVCVRVGRDVLITQHNTKLPPPPRIAQKPTNAHENSFLVWCDIISYSPRVYNNACSSQTVCVRACIFVYTRITPTIVVTHGARRRSRGGNSSCGNANVFFFFYSLSAPVVAFPWYVLYARARAPYKIITTIIPSYSPLTACA